MQTSRQTAGETATTKPGWGIVALVSLMVATTMGGSFIVTAISVAFFAFSAWKGGYMEGTSQQLRNDLTKPAKAGERRAA